MFKCETCSKEYSSNKRYLTHIEKCGNEDIEYMKNRSSYSDKSAPGMTRMSSMSSMSNMLDLDDDLKSVTKYSVKSDTSQLVESLSKDKDKYKNELKKYKIKALEFTRKAQKKEDYLVSEKDELIDRVNSLTEENTRDKELLHDDFTNKLLDEKKRLESRYTGNNNTIKKLQTTNEKLQSILNTQIEEKEKNRLESANQLADVIEQNRTEIEQLQVANNRLYQTLERERSEVRKHQDNSSIMFKREKEQALIVLEAEKDTLIQSLQFSIRNLQKDKELADKKYSQMIIDEKSTYELAIQELHNIISRMKDTHTRNIEQLKNNHASFMSNSKEQYTIALTSLTEKHSQEKLMIDAKNFDTHKNNSRDSFIREQELSREIEILNKKIISIEEAAHNQTEKNKKDAENYVLATEKKQNEEIESIKLNINKMQQADLDERDKIINEIQRLNHSLGAQVGQYSSAIDNIKADTSRLKMQFIINLNKQKEDDLKIIKDLEEKIQNLKINEEIIKKKFTLTLNNQRNELLENNQKDKKSTQAQCNESIQKIEETVRELEDKIKKSKNREDNMKVQFTTELNNQRRELLEHNEKSIESFVIERDQLKNEIDQLISTIETNKLDYEAQYQKLTDSFTSKETDLNKQIEQLIININRSEYIIKTDQKLFTAQLVDLVSKHKDDMHKLNK